MTAAYYVPGHATNRLHADPDCHALATASRLVKTHPSDEPERPECSYCHADADEPTAIDDIPGAVPCPCGNGEATRTKRPTADPDDRGRPVRHYHYRHGPCGLGGTIVAVDGDVRRRYGPVFDPGRYAAPDFGVSASD